MTHEVSDEDLEADQRGCDAYHAWRDDQPTDLHGRIFVAPVQLVEAVEEVDEYVPPPCKLQGRLDEIRVDFEKGINMNTKHTKEALTDHIADASKMVSPANLKQLADSFPELNMSNYGAEDVDKLHNWALEVVQAITAIDYAVTPVALPLYEAPQPQADARDADAFRLAVR